MKTNFVLTALTGLGLAVLFAMTGQTSANGSTQAPVGVVSMIESMPIPTAGVKEGDPRRALPFIEVIQWQRYQECLTKNFKSCLQYEWSVPFTTEDAAKTIEEKLSRAWNDYDARTFWRANTAINSTLAFAVNCFVGANFDSQIGAWDGNFLVIYPKDRFCDGLSIGFPTSMPGICGLGDGTLWTDWGAITQNYTEAITHAVTTYYPEYWKTVYETILNNAPAGLMWSQLRPILPTENTGSLVLPVMNFTPNPAQYVELAGNEMGTDIRAMQYLLQNYPFLNMLPISIAKKLLVTLPTEQFQINDPGIKALEDAKTKLTTREDIFARTYQWADTFGSFFGAGPKPKGKTGAATVLEYEGIGHVPIMEVQARYDVEISPRVPILWRECNRLDIVSVIPPVVTLTPIPMPTPMPITHALPRVHTGWVSVPEGYGIPNIEGVPLY